jgi:hypothetical protein
MLRYVYWFSSIVPVILVDFNGILTYFDRISKNSETSSFMKIRPVGSELFHVDGQTDSR